jgi:hypothetical protein
MAQCFHQREVVNTLMEAQTLAYKMNGQYYAFQEETTGGTVTKYIVQWDWR